MDVEHALICSAVCTSDLIPLIDAGITDKYFTEPANLKVWQLVVEHWKEYSKVPDDDAIHLAYPTFEIMEYPEPLEYYLASIRDRHLLRLAMSAVDEVMATAKEGGPGVGQQLISGLRSGIAEALSEVPVGKDVDYFVSYEDTVLPRLLERQSNPGYLRGSSTGVDSLDRVTGGLQKQQLVTIVGVPKSGKSSLLLNMALTTRREGLPCLFFTFEMSAEEQQDRLTSLVASVPLGSVLSGTLTAREMKSVRQEHKFRRLLHGLTIVADTSSVTTLSAVQAKIRVYKPAVLFVDGVYLMDVEQGEPPGSPRALTNITRGLKRMAQAENIPIVCSTQALLARSKGGIQADSAAYSSSFVQDSDIVLGADNLGRNVVKFKVVASRSGPRIDSYVEMDWTRGVIEEIEAAVAETLLSMPESVLPNQHADVDVHSSQADLRLVRGKDAS